MKRMNEVFELPVTVAQMSREHADEITKSGDSHYCLEDKRYWMASDIDHLEAAAHAINNVDALADALEEALLQIEYLHRKFGKTGSGNSVLSRGDAALNSYRGAK